MTSVFVVQHVHSLGDGEEDAKFIGVYSSREKADAAVMRLSLQPGFTESSEDFGVDEYFLDEDHWTEGFITAKSIVRHPAVA